MSLKTQITALLGIEHPILLAPMAGVSGSQLTAAVSAAGGLGLLGGGYCHRDWIRQELDALQGTFFGVGLITWALDKDPEVLEMVLAYEPEAVFLSFGDIGPYVQRIQGAGARVIAQVQTLAGAQEAAAHGADIIVAQGTEAGGHGGARATLPLVAAVVDAVSDRPVLAAGGIADGRGLAAALMLGAQGVVCGTAFCASDEGLNHTRAKSAMIQATGDDTLRSTVFDLARGVDWSGGWKLRSLANDFTARWHNDLDAFRRHLAAEQVRYSQAREAGNFQEAAVIVGEAVDLVRATAPARKIVSAMVREAQDCLKTAPKFLEISDQPSTRPERYRM